METLGWGGAMIDGGSVVDMMMGSPVRGGATRRARGSWGMSVRTLPSERCEWC